MERIRTFEFATSVESLRGMWERGEIPETLSAPIQALVANLLAHNDGLPYSLYLCSADQDQELRDHFAAALATVLQKQLTGSVLVDCNFLTPGLSGIVPQRDALGFLDLLLYGSSLGVITQVADDRLRVIGAGSFPVSKKSPFMMDAFATTDGYLTNQSATVLYCGPAFEEDDSLHPIANHVSLVLVLGGGARTGRARLNRVESRVSSAIEKPLWCVRVSGASVERADAARSSEPVEPAKAKSSHAVESVDATSSRGGGGAAVPAAEELVSSADDAGGVHLGGPLPSRGESAGSEGGRVAGSEGGGTEAGGRDAVGSVGHGEMFSGLRSSTRGGNTVLPRVLVTVVVAALIGFFLWWLHLTRSGSDSIDEPVASRPVTVGDAGEGLPKSVPVAVVSDTAQTGTESRIDSKLSGQSSDNMNVAEPVGDKAPSAASPAPDRAPAFEELEGLSDVAGTYLIHLSSFRGVERARRAAANLVDDGFSGVIVRVDLQTKGLWYRVYVGPIETREEARQVKIKLDENPRVKFTRITRVPG